MSNSRYQLPLHTAMIGYSPVEALGRIVDIGYVVGYDRAIVSEYAGLVAHKISKLGKRMGLEEWDHPPFVVGQDCVPDDELRRDGILPERGEVQLRFKSRAFERKFDELIGT